MLGLPKTTEFNKPIPRSKLFSRAISASSLRDIYDEQIRRILWRNKLSKETYEPYAQLTSASELEVFEIETKVGSLDKRLLRRIDQSIPYYIFHVTRNEDRYQAWIAEKAPAARSIKVENYVRTGWMDAAEFQFEFSGSSPKATLRSLVEQVKTARRPNLQIQLEQCSAFMAYFREMKMSRSYKPVLIMATIQSGGAITLEKAALQFTSYYQGRAKKGMAVEKGYCVYGDPEASINKVYSNLINMPITALCNSGYFVYDKVTRVFSFADGLYDSLTLSEIDEITNICKMRLYQYFEKVR